jgi:hypothetical protein
MEFPEFSCLQLFSNAVRGTPPGFELIVLAV